MKKRVVVSDRFQKKYAYYLTEMEGKNFDKEFKPDLSPQKMLELGVFGGKYLRDGAREFPKKWFRKAKLSSGNYDVSLNYFQVKASQPLKYWIEKGWIKQQDPRGWFQWYCRYYYGRRSKDDARQIKRWKAMQRHVAQLEKNCKKGDKGCRPRQRQALLHWAYDSRKL